MQCPYCLSEVHADASVCKFCTRDLYLFKPMLVKLEALEKIIQETPDQSELKSRISELEFLLDAQTKEPEPKTVFGILGDLATYLLAPLILLLVAHGSITIIYDANILYLRIISMILPLPFGYLLLKSYPHRIFPWFIGVVLLAISSVIGMSWLTSIVDHTPVLPQNTFEWREVIEYAASISFSFLTGMLLGHVNFKSRQNDTIQSRFNAYVKTRVQELGQSGVSITSVHGLMKKAQEYGGTVVALGTTGLSIYTGLKGIVGS